MLRREKSAKRSRENKEGDELRRPRDVSRDNSKGQH
jgi:hypothetical protein